MTTSSTKSLQEEYAPHGRCFGCGPTNDKGLRIRSFPTEDTAAAHVTCDWTPEKHHEAFENVVVAIAWFLASVPLAWGVWSTFKKALLLFQ